MAMAEKADGVTGKRGGEREREKREEVKASKTRPFLAINLSARSIRDDVVGGSKLGDISETLLYHLEESRIERRRMRLYTRRF